MNDNERITLTGWAAINAANADSGIRLNKYSDPTENATENITIEEAESVVMEDPGLIWAEVDVVCEIKGERAECPTGYNIADYYDEEGYHKGPDDNGVTLFYAGA